MMHCLFYRQYQTIFENQYGFQKGKSTGSAVLHLTDTIHRARKKGEFGCAIFLDLAKAFDTVDHSILLKKLEKIGIRGPVLDWFKSYLTDRHQSVICNNSKSNPRTMLFGVPQGSVLGPLLFLLYINDLSLNSTFHHTLFADDTCLFLSHKNSDTLEELVNLELKNITDWLIANKLTLNISKSNFILFTTKKPIDNFQLYISGQSLDRVTHAKYLGVIIDENLNWKEHLKRIHTRIKQNVGIIHKVGRLLPRKNLLSLYYSFVHSHLSYCITSWGSLDTKGLSKINDSISKCVNFINKLKHDNEPNFTPLNLSNTYKLESCKLIHKFLNNSLPSSLNHLFHRSPDLAIRKNSQNNVRTIHFNQADHPIMFHGPQSWNLLNCYKLAQLSSSFSTNLKKNLLNSM